MKENQDPYKDCEKIDMTPTWESILPIHLEAWANNRAPSAKKEITRMAKLADKYNNLINNHAVVDLKPDLDHITEGGLTEEDRRELTRGLAGDNGPEWYLVGTVVKLHHPELVTIPIKDITKIMRQDETGIWVSSNSEEGPQHEFIFDFRLMIM